ncbi:hypothetical protein SODALDRAFT_323287 [Sodiomyces alkalinus F11]|uniref:Uncharacterized protein n=1 Tax=Sodiomyces alkalinus (strain CBS 110278 / VKM F-3762 / F11) TaxID=1314773 RepID=A0A3N2PZZ7_SODAK|nr:hypothetical protein SODALDRAFT_323287 [Sodiomyces alkalinus F11]ROT40006.1 hypothetical protein SODALDRAFT_323287 [Sodiomyces alkalinus F11]
MAPIRRYLRITKYSVLECRIYLDNPALVQTWLLNPRNPILPKVIESIRPFVLPKLREERERERTRKKNSKKKSIKDVVVHDEFEVSIFLTETPTRHSLLTKQKHFREKATGKLKSTNSKKLTDIASEAPVGDPDADGNTAAEPIVLREESDEEAAAALENIPPVTREAVTGRPKRRRHTAIDEDEEDEFRASSDDEAEEDRDANASTIEIDSDVDEEGPPPPKRRRKQATGTGGADDETNDKKKLAMDITFEGFAIYGRVLCLVVKKRDGAGITSGSSRSTGKGAASAAAAGTTAKPAGQAVMENWISSTQAPNPGAEEDAS